MAKRNALGRGLGALIDDAEKMKQAGISEIELTKIEANPFQPRSKFDEESLEELAASIREIGLIQPITLRKNGSDSFQIIAGERRFRAAQKAGMETIPAYIRHAKDDGMLEMALVENIQREDLDAIEIALSYQRLMDELEFTQEDLSGRVGKKRSTIANYLRLLKLPAIIQKALREKEISMGHARALINIEDADVQEMIYQQIVKYGFSVRRVEEIVRSLDEEGLQQNQSRKKELPKEYRDYKGQLGKLLGSRIGISVNEKGKGKIVIPFKSGNDLERIVKIIENNK
ncbi:ParB/RepB/Spo0J family partition protein [Mariniphaga sediminis]|jgi:ParB family chromosome partitioning protein|uniref:ParB/RepB/Spo0J family partition protein n=1 Tax=Mariniphaga sediminis TaxID=1628158 RepID=A0A399CYU0_9BACT|nr:ParB/RepB/Spo0J family partition protein [Mariniphaga sediminis]RIH64128.1 ParB/RepB/Spo0J family partition protein [Mariniphaga sediminis]